MKEIVFAGFGGQGILTAGMVLTYIAAEKDLNPVWMPSYGATVRGGTANCVVKFGDSPRELVGSPAMENADILISMNEPSLKFISVCKEDALVMANTDAIRKDYEYPKDKNIAGVDCVRIAESVQAGRSANLVMLGAMLAKTGLFEKEFSIKAMCDYFSEKGKGKFNESNTRALAAGFDYVTP